MYLPRILRQEAVVPVPTAQFRSYRRVDRRLVSVILVCACVIETRCACSVGREAFDPAHTSTLPSRLGSQHQQRVMSVDCVASKGSTGSLLNTQVGAFVEDWLCVNNSWTISVKALQQHCILQSAVFTDTRVPKGEHGQFSASGNWSGAIKCISNRETNSQARTTLHKTTVNFGFSEELFNEFTRFNKVKFLWTQLAAYC